VSLPTLFALPDALLIEQKETRGAEPRFLSEGSERSGEVPWRREGHEFPFVSQDLPGRGKAQRCRELDPLLEEVAAAQAIANQSGAELPLAVGLPERLVL
jgi:hypothetical protein